MLKNNKISIIILFISLLVSCNNKILHEFKNVNNEWLRCDTLKFCYYDINNSHTCYNLRVEVRNTADYNYKNLFLRIETYSKKNGTHSIDSITCNIFDENGIYTGNTAGIMYQSTTREIEIHALPYDTLYFKINHLMNSDTITGISDVGIKLQGCDRHQSSEN